MIKCYRYYVLFVILLISSNILLSQSYLIDWYAMSNGFGYSFSDNTFFKSSIGQPFIGVSTGNSSSSIAGFFANSYITSIVGIKENDNKFATKIYPIPAHNKITIEFELQEFAYISIKLIDILGIEKLILMDEFVTAGKYNKLFELVNNNGLLIPPGLYLLKIEMNGNNFKYSNQRGLIIIR